MSEKKSIVYKSDFIEEDIIVRNISNKDSKDDSHSYSWNYKDHTFGYQLDKWDVEKLFRYSDEVIIR